MYYDCCSYCEFYCSELDECMASKGDYENNYTACAEEDKK